MEVWPKLNPGLSLVERAGASVLFELKAAPKLNPIVAGAGDSAVGSTDDDEQNAENGVFWGPSFFRAGPNGVGFDPKVPNGGWDLVLPLDADVLLDEAALKLAFCSSKSKAMANRESERQGDRCEGCWKLLVKAVAMISDVHLLWFVVCEHKKQRKQKQCFKKK